MKIEIRNRWTAAVIFECDPALVHANYVQQIFLAQGAWGMAGHAFKAISGGV